MAHTVNIGIDGMTCASCVARVERTLKKVPGVEQATVNLATETARLEISSELQDSPTANGVPVSVLRAIRNAGYSPRANTQTNAQATPTIAGLPKDVWPLVIGIILCLPLVAPMLLAPWMGSDHAHSLVPVWLQFVLGTAVQFTLGLRFYKAAWHAIQQRTGNMELLVALGTSAAWLMSVWLMLKHHGHEPHVYFESAAVVITLVQLGKWLEQRAKRQTTAAIYALQALRPETAHWLSPMDGEQDVPVEELMVGDTIVVKPGERIAADGKVLQGHSHVDTSMVTGEPLPVEVQADSTVTGGTLNGNGVLHVQVSHTAANSVLSHIIRLVEDAQAVKPPIQKLVDKVAAVFVPAVLVIATLTLLINWGLGVGTEASILRAVAVLVIACPCALGLATPVAIMAGTGVAAKHGILIKDSLALERAHAITTIAFDKTGTLTEGKPILAAHTGQEEALRTAASLQQGSEHPLAQALLQTVQEQNLPPAQALQAIPGCGLQGYVNDQLWQLGSLAWMQAQEIAVPEGMQGFVAHWQAQGATLSALAHKTAPEGSGGVIHALFAFTDTIKPQAPAAIAQLQQMGIQTVLISGDNQAAAHALAQKVGIQQVHAQVLPADKAAIVQKLQTAEVVAMVGDGINDAPALAQADVGMAMANPQGGTDVALHAADITLMRGDVALVAGSIAVSRATVRKIRQNLFWAFAYNVVGIPLAAIGLLSPMVAGAAMALSSVSVVTNALLLRRWHP